MNKIKYLQDSLKNVYCALKPSKISGVGVFAIRTIPKGIYPFELKEKEKYYKFKIKDLSKIPPFGRKIIKNYCVKEKESYWIPFGDLNKIFIYDFLNHSLLPNLSSDFISLREIKEGEELTANYKEFDESWREKIKLNYLSR